MISRLLILSVILFVFNSCSHFIKKTKRDVVHTISHKEVSSDFIYEHAEDNYTSPYGEIPMDFHPDVEKWTKYFTDRGRDQMKIYLERSSRYLSLMKSVLKENKLPKDLVYIALIESGFSPKALSRSNAVGYWQFIYGTGKRYGLRIDGYVDERRDPVLSTRAAANYFKELFSLFESWPLVLAAYNSGEYRVNRAVLKHYNRNFWYLSSKKALPRETRNYFPKFISAVLIAKNPKKYGFSEVNYQEPIQYDLIDTIQPISLKLLAKQMNIPEKDLKALNPMYKGEYIPVYENKTTLRVPVGTAPLAKASLEKSRMKAPKHSYHYHYWYRVRSGDSLYKIARRHRTTVSKLRRANKLGRSSLIRVGQKLKIPTRRLVASAKKASAKRSLAKANKEFHIVHKGQSLASIARLYGLKLSYFKELNNIQGNPIIHPNQKLRIKKAPAVSSASKKSNYYIVRKGDTLISIANKHNISLPKLMKRNSMDFQTVLLTGTRLIIPK